jgi:hypothetical protein
MAEIGWGGAAQIGKRKTILALDSGAWSVFKRKKKITINIDRLVFFLLIWNELFELCLSLDIIDYDEDFGGGGKSYENWQYIRRYVRDIVPVYHRGKDLKFLESYLRESKYMGVGGLAEAHAKKRDELLGHLWQTDLLDHTGKPRAKIHGLGLTSTILVAKWPWYSVDSTSWAIDAAYRIILVPQKSGSEYDYSKQPIRVSVTPRISRRHPNHIDKLPVEKALHVMEYLEKMGFRLGKGYEWEPNRELGLCNDRTMRYQINAVYYSEMGRATGVKVYLAGNYESLANPEMERSIRQAVFDRGLDYYRMLSFIDYPKILNVIRMKEEEYHGIK